MTPMATGTLARCDGCRAIYDWRKSSSRSLRLTFCSMLCERKANGHTIEDMLAVERNRPGVPGVWEDALPVEELVGRLGR